MRYFFIVIFLLYTYLSTCIAQTPARQAKDSTTQKTTKDSLLNIRGSRPDSLRRLQAAPWDNDTILSGRLSPVVYHVAQEVVVKALRSEQTAAISQSSLSREELQSRSYGQDMPQLLSTTPSVFSYAEGGAANGYSYLRLRGIDQTRINMTLNGVPLNEPEDHGVYFANFTDFAANLQSVEVQRGVGTSSNGAAAYGGSINFLSQNVSQSAGVSAEAGYGSFNSRRFSLSVQSGSYSLDKGELAVQMRYSRTASDNYRYHSGTDASTLYANAMMTTENDLLKVVAFSGRTGNQLSYLPVEKAVVEADPRTNPNRADENDAFGQDFLQLQYLHSFEQNVLLVCSAYYTWLAGSINIALAPDAAITRFGIDSDWGGFFSTLTYYSEIGKFDVGIHANSYRRDHFARTEPRLLDTLYFNSGYKNEASAFVKWEYYVGRNTSLFADAQLRYTDFRYETRYALPGSLPAVNWLFFNPKAGIRQILSDKVIAYASVGTTRREPTRSDMFAGADNIDSSNFAELQNLQRVKPESVLDVEAGVLYRSEYFTGQANIFLMEFRDEIAPLGTLSTLGIPLRKNVASSYRRGIEAEWKWKLSNRIELEQNLAVTLARIQHFTRDSDSLSFSNVAPYLTPPFMLRQSLLYKAASWLALRGSAQYVASSFLDNTNNSNLKTPAYVVLDARAEVQALHNLRCVLSVNNILNTVYYSGGYVVADTPYLFAQAPRSIYTSIALSF